MQGLVPTRFVPLALMLSLATALAATTAGASTEAQGRATKNTIAQAGCPNYYSSDGPCLPPLMSAYNYEGEGEQATKLMKATFGPRKLVGMRFEAGPPPGQYEVTRRFVTWHSVPNVEIVAVYEVYVHKHFLYKRLPTGRHGGHATLRASRGLAPPILLLAGRRIQ